MKQLESDIAFHIGKHEAELALKVNSAAYHGDLHQLKSLIHAGADPNKKDYDGRSPLVWVSPKETYIISVPLLLLNFLTSCLFYKKFVMSCYCQFMSGIFFLFIISFVSKLMNFFLGCAN